MKDWKDSLVKQGSSVREVLLTINKSSAQVAIVVAGDLKLLGIATDGDVRRGILNGVGLDDAVEKIMNRKPKHGKSSDSQDQLIRQMKKLQVRHLPVVNAEGILVGIEFLDDLLRPIDRENPVVLMAGGLGKRMSPLTDDCPKPMLKVGGKPVLEIILDQFVQSGFKKFHISVNYMAEVIENYFGDGSKWGVEITYLREKEKLGTAGALSLLPERPKVPLIVMNGDLLTKLDMRRLLDFHEKQKAKLTMCVREYDFQVPYGVVRLGDGDVVGIDEKPVQKFFVNAGIYVLSPAVLERMDTVSHMDMPSLVQSLIEAKGKVAAFPIQEYWLDIGQHADFERANWEYAETFKG